MTSRLLETIPPVIDTPNGRYPLHEYHLELGGRQWVVFHTGVALTYDDELYYLRHMRQHLPYGVALWPSSIALAHHLADMGARLDAMSVLELGAGTGLPGIVAASLGARVVQTDRHQLPLSVCRCNREANGGRDIDLRMGDWTAWTETERFDYIVGSDILYTEALHPFLTEIFTRNLRPGGKLVLADPFRAPSVRYLSSLEDEGWAVSGTRWNLGGDDDPRPVGVFELSPAASG